ncbi:hypothetical protein BofuT4_uP019210.1 [Botrytis cinerea T4]|uniref:Uncharacterized protein n=1 Tax=Botryotinia fuckeliana (strain T4) TaxID=999810 RepID=G2YIS8_BOTF4|nr:hypothetical protein BofuT4_uP019210.1 [Botrytis cinerea T4]
MASTTTAFLCAVIIGEISPPHFIDAISHHINSGGVYNRHKK